MERAGFGIRLGAFILDAIIYSFISGIIGFIVGLVLPGETLISIAINLVLAFTYYVVIPYRENGKTVGKMITNIRIARLDESPLSMWTLFLREFIGKAISSIILFIGYLIALGGQKRALHDYVAGTVVLRDSK